MTVARILIVEDEKIIARGVEKQLQSMGYHVVGLAGSGEEAIQKAVALRPTLILMDISLGDGIDGVEAATRIRKQLDVPVVYLTAYSDPDTLRRARITEPFGYILKPYEDRDLQTAIEIGLYRHELDRRLRENEQWLAATLGSIGDGVIATDEQGRVRFMNALAETLTGWPQTDALGKDVHEVFDVVDRQTRQRVANPILNALERGEATDLVANALLLQRGGGEVPIDDSAAPIRGRSGAVVGGVLVFRDITERCRLEEHLRQAQKMEAVGRLAGGIAHDFNNIMTIIMGFSEVLLLDKQTSGGDLGPLRAIHDAGKRAAGLVKQIMAFSRKQMLVPSVLNLNTVLRDMSALVVRLIGSNIEFVTEPAADLAQVEADPTQLGQVVLNLTANARDAMPTGGKLTLATANAELGVEVTRLHPDVKPGRYVVLSVSDTGAGMPPEVLTHVFEPFFTTKPFGQGTGLGLASVYGIVKQSQGHIEVSSQVGAGTTFRVYLPAIADQATSAVEETLGLSGKGRETILLVEDDALVREMTAMVLRERGYQVLEAFDGLDGVRVAEAHMGPLHLLMTDLVMPRLSGREMSERVTKLRPDVRVLFMSGYTEDVVVQQGVESAAVNFLQKPFTLANMTRKVREILDR